MSYGLTGTPSKLRGTSSIFSWTQVRHVSRRRIAYPFYPFKKLGRQHPKKHDTNLMTAMRQFLGPKNYKGEYVMNKYFTVPTNHVPNYIKPDLERGQSLEHPVTKKPLQLRYDGTLGPPPVENKRLQNIFKDRLLQPFPSNPHCKTNYVLSPQLKQSIFEEITVEGLSAQQVSQKYGLKIPRVEAIVKLVSVENSWNRRNRVSSDLKTMDETLYRMFPVFDSDASFKRENLSEIPVPQKTLASRFLTIAESEPFGPVDAAHVLELEPAVETLRNLSTVGEHSSGHQQSTNKNTKVIYGELVEGERSQYKFTNAKVGKVGYRYGSGNRDNKKDRRIGFNKLGQMVYI